MIEEWHGYTQASARSLLLCSIRDVLRGLGLAVPEVRKDPFLRSQMTLWLHECIIKVL